MESKSDWAKGQAADSDILFSQSVKAGKRIYYVDVKRDRKGEYYISITESKRLKEPSEAGFPMFEKHKIFLYSEDLEKFQTAFSAAADYTREHSAQVAFTPDWVVSEKRMEESGAEEDFLKIDMDF